MIWKRTAAPKAIAFFPEFSMRTNDIDDIISLLNFFDEALIKTHAEIPLTKQSYDSENLDANQDESPLNFTKLPMYLGELWQFH